MYFMAYASTIVQRAQGLRHVDTGVLVIVLVFLILLPLSTPRIYATDEVQYFAYVRSLYFDHDLDFRNEYAHFAGIGLANGDPAVYNALLRDHAVDPPVHPVTGMLRNVAPIGAAIMWLPGYILADLSVHIANRLGADIAADGYAPPYIWAVCWMSALYALGGLVLTYRLARRYTGVFAATLSTVTVWLATPLLFYTYIAMPWSHATAFFLFALFLTIWLYGDDAPLARRLARRTYWQWALLGLVAGLMTMTREQLGLLLIVPALEGIVAYVRLLRQRAWLDLAQLLAAHMVFLACLLLILMPQFLTYQVLNGRPLPSTTVTDKLGASAGVSPHFFDTLVHPRHGAFLWSPVLAIGLIGLGWLARRDALLALLLGMAFLGQTYLNGTFGSTWHLSGSFGFRRLIECTPIFVLGLAALIDVLHTRVGRWPLLGLALVLIYWNVGLIAQWTVVRVTDGFRQGLIWDQMLYYQFVEVPRQVVEKLALLVFDRCKLLENC